MRRHVPLLPLVLMAALSLSCNRTPPQSDSTLVAPFKHDLHGGMTRDQVEKYLSDHHLRYSSTQGGTTYKIKIGEETGNRLFCDRWVVYADLDFDPKNLLTAVREHKVQHCF